MAVVTFSNIKGGGGSGAPSGITFLNSDYTLEFIESAVTEAVDSALTAYTRTEDFATINGSAITEGGDLTIEAVPYTAGTNIDITDHVISVTGITVPTDISDLNDDIGIATTAWTNSAITNATSGKMDTSAMSAYTPTSGFSTINGSAITSGDNLIIEGTPYSGGTGIGIENHIISVTGDYETVVELTQDEYDALTAYSENTTYIITDAPSINMSAYTPTSGFSTINGSAITSGGNITIEEVPYSAGTNINISDHVISVTGITVPTKLSDLQNDEGFITTADTQNFVTSGDVKTQIEGYNYINSGDAQTQIDNSISGKVDTSALTEYYTSAETNTAIENAVSGLASETYVNNAVSGKMDTSGMTAYATTAFTEQTYLKEHQSLAGLFASVDYVSSAKTIYFYDKDNTEVGTIDTTDFVKDGMVDNVYISGDTLYIVFNTDAGKETIEIALTDIFNPANYYTKSEVDSAITAATDGLASEVYVDNSVSGKADTTALTQYYTSAQTDTAISNAVSGLASTEYVDNSVSGKVDTSALTSYYTSAQTDTAISNATSGLASTVYVDNSVSGKVDTSAMTAYWTSAETESAITAATEDFVTSADVETQITDKGYITGYTETDPVFQSSPASGISAQDILDWDAKLDSSDLIPYYTSAETDTAISNAVSGLATEQYVDNSVSGKVDTSAMTQYYTSAQTDTQISNATSGKQDTLISGTNIKTINNESILGSGNIVISGGSEYSAGTNININANNVISVTGITEQIQEVEDHLDDVEEVTASALTELKTTKLDSTALTQYYTSAQTNTAITTATQHMVTSLSDSVIHIESVTQAEYDAMESGGTLDMYTLYVIKSNS